MKRGLSLMIVLALLMCMVPAAYAEPAQQTLTLVPGENPVTLVPDTNYTLRLNLGTLDKPAGTLTWTGDVTVVAKGETLSSPYNLENYAPKVQMIATVQTETAVNFIVTLPEEEKPQELVLGENAVEVARRLRGEVGCIHSF